MTGRLVSWDALATRYFREVPCMATSCMVLTAPQCTVESTGPPERAEQSAVLAISGNGQLNIVLTMIALRFQTPMGNNLYIK
jgi:hypothetical protein